MKRCSTSLIISLLVIQSCQTLQPHGLQTSRLLYPWNSPSKNTGVGNHSLLQVIFPTQASNLGLLHCRQTLYHLSHQGSPNGTEVDAFKYVCQRRQLRCREVDLATFSQLASDRARNRTLTWLTPKSCMFISLIIIGLRLTLKNLVGITITNHLTTEL